MNTTLETWYDMIHGWQPFAVILSSGQHAMNRIGDFIRERISAKAPAR